MMFLEEWRDIKGYEGFYQVSNLGRVKTLINQNKLKDGILSGILDGSNKKEKHLYVNLYKKGKVTKIGIHRLVAMAFIPNPNNLPFVNHKNEVGTDNRVENLEWCTLEYNNQYGTAIKRKTKTWQAKVKSVLQLLNGKIIAEFPSASAARKAMGKKSAGSTSQITGACQGKYKTAWGYEWKYKEI